MSSSTGHHGHERREDGSGARREAARLLRGAGRAVVLTGAGVSAESGVPTFRGDEGLWREHRPEDLATPRAFARDPRLVWDWYAWRRRKVSGCEPNAAHLAIARWSLRRSGVLVVTQNVDDLHARALLHVECEEGAHVEDEEEAPGGVAADVGSDPAPDPAERLLRLHGSLFRVRCTACAYGAEHREPVDARAESSLPRCPECGELLRPDVVWFGESLDRTLLERALDSAGRADACLVVGTSAVVQPAASVATVAKQAGASLVEVNPEETPVTRIADVSLRAPAGDAVPGLLGPDEG